MSQFVSVILPVHNRAASVGRAIESVLSQSYRARELIVVDDGSTDGTRDVVARYAPDVILLEQPRSGAYAARNLALRHARGELVAFIDSDDAWRPHRLARQVSLFARAEVGLVYGDARVVTPEGPTRRTQFGVTAPHRGRVAAAFAFGNFVPTITVLARREALGFFEDVPLAADYLAWFRLAQRWELDYIDDVLADYTVHAGGISQDLGRSLAARIELFARELDRTSDPGTRAILRRLLANLSLLLAIAFLRRRARRVAHPLRLACRTLLRTGVPGGTAAFLVHHALSRGRHYFA